MASRSYGQHCAVAKSLDLVGDRWTLLVVRELLDGPRRYGDLLATLTPIATDMLASRLRDLEANGLVRKRAMPRPATGATYELTEDGLALEDVVHAYARWGRHLLSRRASSDVVRPEWLVRAVRAYVRDDRSGPAVTFRLDMPEGSVAIRIDADGVHTVDGQEPVDVTLSGRAETLSLAMDPAEVAGMVSAGRLRVDGDPDAIRRLASVFAPPRRRAG